MSDDFTTAGSFGGGYSSQPFNIPVTKPKRYTLTDLRNDQEFVETSERFLSSVGEGDSVGDLFGYFREADYNLADGIKAFADSKKFTEEQKLDYAYLRNKFNNAAIGGFGEWVRAGANVTKEIFTDPTMMASILFIPWSGGTSAAARIAAGKAVQTGLKMLAGKQVAKDVAKGAALLGKVKKKTGVGRMADPVTGNAVLTKNAMTSILSTEGLVYASGTDLVRQGIDVNTDRRDDINLAQTAAYGAIGAAIPLGLRGAGAGISKFQSSVANRRLARLEGGEDYKAGIFDKGLIKTDEIIEQLTPNLLRLTRFAQKPTSMFIKKMEDSEVLNTLIKLFRYDTDKSILDDPSKIIKRTGWSFFENIGARLGPKREQILEILQPLKEIGTITKPKAFSEDAFFKLPSKLYKAPKATKQSYRKSYERISDPVNDALAYYLRTGRKTVTIDGKRVSFEKAFKMTEKTTDDILKAGDALKVVLQEIRKDAIKAGIEVGKIKNYLPRGFNFSAVKKELDNFNKGIEGKLVKEIRRAEKVKDDADIINILESILNPSSPVGTSQALLIATGKGAARGRKAYRRRIPKFTKPRQLKNIKDSNIDEYLDNNVENLMYDYAYSSSSYIQRKIDLGEDLAEFVERYLNPIKAELKAKGKVLTRREKNNLVDIYLVTTGQVSQIDSGFLRSVADLAIVGNQLSLLPLATITSLPEIAVPLVRGAGKTLTQKGKAGVKGELGEGGIRTFWNTAEDYRKMWWNEVKKDIADGRPEALKELNRFGRAMNRANDDRSLAMFGQGYGKRATTLQNKFFKVNLLHDWTRFVQVTSFNVGKSKIYENLHELATNKNISKAKKLRLSNQLRELNVDITAGKRWVKAGGKASGKFYNENFLRSAARYVDEVIMNPTAAANQKPLWHSMPSTRWAFGLMGFPTAFSNTVLKNAAREVVQDMRQHGLSLHRYGPTAGVISGVTTMLGIGLFGNTLRTGGRNIQEIKEGKETIGGEILDSALRTGLLGPTEQLYRAQLSTEYVNAVRAITSRFTGPAVDDAIRVWDSWVGLGLSFAVDEIPGITLLRTAQPELYKALVKEARKYDKAMGLIPSGKTKEKEEESRPALLQFFEGGKISKDYPVPNVAADPSERINPSTGQPYDAEMERLGFAVGGETKLIENENIASVYFNDNPNDLEDLRKLIDYTPPPEQEKKPLEWNDVKTYMKEQFGDGAFKRAAQQFPYLLAAAPEDLGRLAALPYDIASQHMPLPNIGAKERLETPFAFQRFTSWAADSEKENRVFQSRVGKGLFTSEPLMPTIDKPQHTLGELFYMFLVDPTIAGPMIAASLPKAAPLFLAMTTKGGIKTTPTKYVKPTTQELQATYKATKTPELDELGFYSQAEKNLVNLPEDQSHLKGQQLLAWVYGRNRNQKNDGIGINPVTNEEKQILNIEKRVKKNTTPEELISIIQDRKLKLRERVMREGGAYDIDFAESIHMKDPLDDSYDYSKIYADEIEDDLQGVIRYDKESVAIRAGEAPQRSVQWYGDKDLKRSLGEEIFISSKKHSEKIQQKVKEIQSDWKNRTNESGYNDLRGKPFIDDQVKPREGANDFYKKFFDDVVTNATPSEVTNIAEILSAERYNDNPYVKISMTGEVPLSTLNVEYIRHRMPKRYDELNLATRESIDLSELDIYAFGNEDVGWSLIDENQLFHVKHTERPPIREEIMASPFSITKHPAIVDSFTGSRGEVEVQLKEYMREGSNYELGWHDTGRMELLEAQLFGQISLPGGKNYRETPVDILNPEVLPEHTTRGKKPAGHWEHWETPNIVTVTTTDRTLNTSNIVKDGKQSALHMEEVQSQVHQAGADPNKGYFDPYQSKQYEELENALEAASDKLAIAREEGPTKIKATEAKIQRLQEAETEADLAQADFAENLMGAPDLPLKKDRYISMFIKKNIMQAIREGKDYITLANPATIMKRWNKQVQVADGIGIKRYHGGGVDEAMSPFGPREIAAVSEDGSGYQVYYTGTREFPPVEGRTSGNWTGLKTYKTKEELKANIKTDFPKLTEEQYQLVINTKDKPFTETYYDAAKIDGKATRTDVLESKDFGGYTYFTFDIKGEGHVTGRGTMHYVLYKNSIPRVANKVVKKLDKNARTSYEKFDYPPSTTSEAEARGMLTEEVFTIPITEQMKKTLEAQGGMSPFGYAQGGFVDTEKDPLHRLGFTGGGSIAMEDPLARLGFTGGGGLMVSVGVTPVSEKQISKLTKSLKKRKAKRDGGEIRQRYAFGDRIRKALQRRGEAELLRQEALTNAPSYIRDNVLEATPTALKTYVDKVVLKNREAITEKDFKEKQMIKLDKWITNKIREGIKSGEYFLTKDEQLKAIRNQDGEIGSKSNKDTGYFIDLDTESLDEDIFHTIGSSGVAIRKEKPTYNIFDKYDFAFKFAGKPTPRGFNKDNIKQYRLADEAGRQEASYSTRDWRGKKLLNYALPAAERYGAGQLPDELTATQLSNLEGKEVKPESVNINIGSALNIDENEWAELMEQANTNRDNIDSWINDRYSKVEDSLLTPVKVQGN